MAPFKKTHTNARYPVVGMLAVAKAALVNRMLTMAESNVVLVIAPQVPIFRNCRRDSWMLEEDLRRNMLDETLSVRILFVLIEG